MIETQFLQCFTSDFSLPLKMDSLKSTKVGPNTCDCSWERTSFLTSFGLLKPKYDWQKSYLPNLLHICLVARKESIQENEELDNSKFLVLSVLEQTTTDILEQTGKIRFNSLRMAWIESHWMKSFLLFKMDTYSVQFSSYGHYSKKSVHDIVSGI